MSGDRAADIAFACLVLLLPLYALIARRVPLGRTFKMALAWLAIFGIGLLIVSRWDRFAAVAKPSSDQRADRTTIR